MATTHRNGTAVVKYEKEIQRRQADGRDLRAIGYLNYLRQLERKNPDKPRIGKNATLAQEIVRIGQDPSMSFPEADFSRIDDHRSGKPSARNAFLGFFGGHGAMPLDQTEEVYRWAMMGDMAYVEFTDIFATRFQQLYFRAWSDGRAITQFDHPGDDRFGRALGSLVGIGTQAYTGRDDLHDINKLALAPLSVGRVKSPVKLQQMLEQDMGADVHVEEFVPTWVIFEPDNHSMLGQNGSTLGRDMVLGGRAQSVQDKIQINIATKSNAEYRSFLPGGESHARLESIVAWYLGMSCEMEVVLTLPADAVEPAVLGKSAELGWMAALPPAQPYAIDEKIKGATYALHAA
ncbi:type VI secretion system baseplate subunit TssG [Loktanella sp. F6476L]|uniref:type VI secretion system baseplate subunit TssG n=1 Tax=Loktanella sp. F6476L TaxID=2926405 RepID=UPI001FF5C29C|nr:type VI secretion system baseplate subunit TssG [Loktanella sp. F6476L]MCK0122303.1 type VI secretion system baseplate subunit TssG [Loktanella sp. F6476L]